MTSMLELAADLERLDAALAAEIGAVARLSTEAREIGARADDVGEVLNRAPAERAVIDRAEAAALVLRDAAEKDVIASRARVEKLESASRANSNLVGAERDLGHAQEAARDAHARVERVAVARTTLAEAEHEAHADVPTLVARAQAIAALLAKHSRVSASGRALPEPTLVGIVEWAARVRAALLVVRGQLDVERDRLVREANELGSVVLGEEIVGASVELVGRRVRMVLAR